MAATSPSRTYLTRLTGRGSSCGVPWKREALLEPASAQRLLIWFAIASRTVSDMLRPSTSAITFKVSAWLPVAAASLSSVPLLP